MGPGKHAFILIPKGAVVQLCRSYLGVDPRLSPMVNMLLSTSRFQTMGRTSWMSRFSAYMVYPVDGYAVQKLKVFDGKKLKSTTQDGWASRTKAKRSWRSPRPNSSHS